MECYSFLKKCNKCVKKYISSNAFVISYPDSRYSLYDTIKMAPDLCDLPPKKHISLV